MEFKLIRKLFHVKENQGFSELEIETAIAKWGSLPELLQEYFKQLGRNKKINATFNFLMEPNKLFEKNGFLIFYIENQGCVFWGIKLTELHVPDPAIYCSVGEDFLLEAETLSQFLNAMALFQAASWGLTYLTDSLYSISEEQAELVQQKYQKIPYELNVWLSVSFYGNEEDEVIMLIENDDYDLNYASEDESCFKQMEEFFEEIGVEAY